ncbi:hypothetical protein ET495_06265 [Xylanimonas allomyrinae]|uniref:Uncharacterized protein n=1 Tax=Xylanimonas allomyrinae TaxID=2509459 RepID=A0A4V0YE43_9MICO|nr:hypothetical protein [Xylanimonas allomyrinae]QAY62911.1 hypothetical protein ET495_06265 [Xylanimonas allomyrinae]
MAGTSTGGGTGRDDDAQGDGARGASREPPLGEAEVEARWVDIVARLAELDDGEAPADPAAQAPAAESAPTAPGHVVARTAGPRDWPTTPEVEALEEAESHFAPPDPGPVLTSRDPLATLAWAGAAGIPLLAVVALVVRSFLPGMSVPGWAGPTAALVFLASVAVLVWRMPHRRDPSDHDDGAVV